MRATDIEVGVAYRYEDSWPAKFVVDTVTRRIGEPASIRGWITSPSTRPDGDAVVSFCSARDLRARWDESDEAELERYRSADRLVAELRAAGADVRRDYSELGKFVVDFHGLERLHRAATAPAAFGIDPTVATKPATVGTVDSVELVDESGRRVVRWPADGEIVMRAGRMSAQEPDGNES